MLDRVPRRSARRSAAVALLASVLVHVGLLFLFLWPAAGREQDGRTNGPPIELVVLVGSDDSRRGDKDVSLSPIEPPPAPARKTATVLDTPTISLPAEEGPNPVLPVRPAPHSVSRPGEGGDPSGSGTSFFRVAAVGRSVVYVLDRSMSMGQHDGLRQARAELLASLEHLPPNALFQIIAYNQTAEPIAVRNYGGMLPADAATVFEVARLLTALRPVGLTDHVQALRRGLELRPDVIYFATDADELTAQEVATISRCNGGHCSIHVIEFSNRPDSADSPLRQLAERNRGTYRRVAVKEL